MFHLQSVFSIISWICLILIVCTFNLNKCSVQVLTMLIKFATLNNIYLLNGVSIHSSLFLWFTMHRLFCDWSEPQIQWENNRLNSYKIQYRIEFWGFYPLIDLIWMKCRWWPCGTAPLTSCLGPRCTPLQ